MIKRVFLIGYPVAHSLSPALQNAAFDALGMDYRYELLATPPDQLAVAVARVRNGDCAGANVTVPHKQAVMPLLDDLSEHARRVGAVNTLVKRNGGLVGENTDVCGFMQALQVAQIAVRGKHVVLLGAGGAARAVAFGLAGAAVKRITVINRTAERAQHLVTWLQLCEPELELAVNVVRDIETAELVVNATSVGMSPNVDATPLPQGCRLARNAVAYDLVYNPAETRFLREARAIGVRAISGMGMLAYQGQAAFRLWTGRDAPEVWSRNAALAHSG